MRVYGLGLGFSSGFRGEWFRVEGFMGQSGSSEIFEVFFQDVLGWIAGLQR